MTQPLVEQQTSFSKLAQELREMADRMEQNGPEYFGGAFVVIPPVPGEVVKTLVLDKAQDPAQFWALLKTKCDMALAGLDNLARGQQGWR